MFVIPFKEKPITVQFSSVAQSCPTLCDPMNHSTPPCPSPTPGVHPDSRPSSQWCHPAISSSVVPFSSCPQSLPVSESFPMSQLFAWGRGELSLVLTYTPWTQVAYWALAKEFPNSSQGPLGFAKEFEFNIQTYEPRFSDLYPLIQLLVSKAKQGVGKERRMRTPP